MSNIYIYLAGPVTNCTNHEANYWREDFIDLLEACPKDKIWSHGFVGVSPLRCEPLVGARYSTNPKDPEAIVAKNKLDVQRCDLTLAYQSGVAGEPISVGTQQEIGWAVGMNKPVILVTDNDYVRNNPVIKATVPWRFRYHNDKAGDGFEEAIEVIEGLFGVYSG